MSPTFYYFLHFAGVMCLLLGMGAILGMGEDRKHINKFVGIFHGIGVLLLLVSGFGLVAKLQTVATGFPVWLIIKLVLWICLSMIMILAKRKICTPKATAILALVLALTAAAMCVFKPFVGG